MELRNLGRNILYLVCNELRRRNECDPLEAGFIYRTYSDIPRDVVAARIDSLVEKGWLRWSEHTESLHLTRRGLELLRGIVASKLARTCPPPGECREGPSGSPGPSS